MGYSAVASGGDLAPNQASGAHSQTLPRVVVVGLGPAGADHVSPAAIAALASVALEARFLRTDQHPAAAEVDVTTTFDHRYEHAATLDHVYAGIVADLEEAAARLGRIVYAVPGSPLVAERTVEMLRRSTAVTVEVQPAISFLDLAWARLGVDPLAVGVRLVDGHRFAEEAAGERGPLLVAQTDSPAVLSDVKLALDPDDPLVEPLPAVVLHHLGLPDESLTEVAWQDLDRFAADHLTTLWIPALGAPVARELARFELLVRVLRDRCPWDRQQTHESLARYLLEEAHEAIEAIENLGSDPGPSEVDALCGELGDVLFQVFIHSTLAAEEGRFTLADVARTVHDKLVRRHPHVFGEASASTAEEVVANWDTIKAAERAAAAGSEAATTRSPAGPASPAGPGSPFAGIPATLPALATAAKVLRRAASQGLAPPTDVPVPAATTEQELGDLLLSVATAASRDGLDPESALRKALRRYTARSS